MKKGKLIFVGLGIKSINHITLESVGWIKECDLVIYHVVDPLTEYWIKSINNNCISLSGLYKFNKPRIETYKEMINTIIEPVKIGKTVCVAFYGNPAFYVYATHKAAKIAKRNGHYVEINPGISSLDCLLAELDIDIVNEGLLVLEATSILYNYKKIDTSMHLVVMQPGPIGEPNYKKGIIDKDALKQFSYKLKSLYGPNHYIYIYDAARYSLAEPGLKKCKLSSLEKHLSVYLSTLYIPPKKKK